MDNNKKTFKDFIVEDLDVFFELDEFATKHELDGEMLPLVVVDSQSDNNMTGFPREQMYAAQEVFKQYKTIYVKSTDFYVPSIDSEITLDNIAYYVEEAADEQGIIRILLSLNES